jgi:HAE1 family hydrophobic/amphiphilic exporter-1
LQLLSDLPIRYKFLKLNEFIDFILVVGIFEVDDAIKVKTFYMLNTVSKNEFKQPTMELQKLVEIVVLATLVIVVVFLPIALGTGLVSNIATIPSCVTVIISPFSFGFVRLIIIPWLSSSFWYQNTLREKSFRRIIFRF